jgi:hypothetical protein
MNSEDRRMILKVARKTGLGVSFTKQSLQDFRDLGYEPTSMNLIEYMKLRLSAVALYNIDEDGNKIPYTKEDYIKAAIRSDK